MNTQTAEKTCSACAHWKSMDGSKGQCRVNPPQAMSFVVDNETKFETCFPETKGEDWCGQFQLR